MKRLTALFIMILWVAMVLPVAADELVVRGPAVPSSGDLNGDGRPDIAVGSGDGRVYLSFQVPNASGEASFTRPLPVLIGGEVLDIGDYASPVLVDMDRDGLLDLLLGNAEGRLLCHYNRGSASHPVFTEGVPLLLSTTPAGAVTPAVRPVPTGGTPTPVGVTSPADEEYEVAVKPPLPMGVAAGAAGSAPHPDEGNMSPRPAAGRVATPAPAIATEEMERPTAASLPTIAVIDFVNEANVVDLGWLGQGVPDILVLSIPISDDYELLPRERYHEQVLNLANIDDAFRDVDYVVKGNYWLEGDDLVIEVTVIDMEAIDIIKGFSSRGSRGNVFPIINQLEQELNAYFLNEFPAR